LWKTLEQNHPYEILEFLGKGSFGEVVKAMHLPTQELVAIKLMKDCFANTYSAKKQLSEINILRKFTEVKGNDFTTKIYDIITP